jgi:hypothetical protein
MSWIRRPQAILVAILLPLMVAIALLGSGVLVADEQDQCTFGPISNARYQDWLTKAMALRRREGDLIGERRVQTEPGRLSCRPSTDLLFEELSNGVTSVEERLAIVHAMMRADGFRLLATEPDLADPYPRAESRVGFKYGKYNLFGLMLLCQLDCVDRAFANLYLQDRPGSYGRNEVRFNFSRALDLESLGRDHVPTPLHPRSCPPMPLSEWAAGLVAPAHESSVNRGHPLAGPSSRARTLFLAVPPANVSRSVSVQQRRSNRARFFSLVAAYA